MNIGRHIEEGGMGLPTPPPRRRRRGFTLIELLIVVAVVIILMSILAPSFGVAVKMARRLLCAGNLHQVGIAGCSYSAASGHFPPEDPGIMGEPAPLKAWPHRFMAYAADPRIFNCPESPDWMRWDGQPFQTTYGSTPFSYALDVWGAADGSYLGWWVTGEGKSGRTGREIADPADFYWIGDSNGGDPEDPHGVWDLVSEVHWFDWCHPWEHVGKRHEGACNMLYAGGNVSWLPRDDIMKAETLPRGSPERIHWRRKVNIDHEPHEEFGN